MAWVRKAVLGCAVRRRRRGAQTAPDPGRRRGRAPRGIALGAAAIVIGLGLSACVGASADAASSTSVPTAVPSAGATSGAVAELRGRGEFPVVSAEQRVRSYAAVRLATMSLEQKIASLFVVHVGGADAVATQQYLAATGAAGVLLLGDNVPGDTAQTAAYTAAIHSGSGVKGLEPIVAIDEEGGIVARLQADVFASAETLKSAPPAATEEAFAQRAALLDAAGVDVNFGIVADVTADPSSFIFERALGIDAAGSAERVAAAVTAENGQVLSTLKHFPGHGAAAGDSHLSVPSTDLPLDAWRSEDAPPFAAGIDAGADLVMFGHLVYGAVDTAPASLSAPWHDILRDELGFEGVIVTDDLLMLEASGVPAYGDRTANAIAALAAGNDLLLYNTQLDLPPLVASIAAAVRSGALPAETIDDAALRVLELRRELWLERAG